MARLGESVGCLAAVTSLHVRIIAYPPPEHRSVSGLLFRPQGDCSDRGGPWLESHPLTRRSSGSRLDPPRNRRGNLCASLQGGCRKATFRPGEPGLSDGGCSPDSGSPYPGAQLRARPSRPGDRHPIRLPTLRDAFYWRESVSVAPAHLLHAPVPVKSPKRGIFEKGHEGMRLCEEAM